MLRFPPKPLVQSLVFMMMSGSVTQCLGLAANSKPYGPTGSCMESPLILRFAVASEARWAGTDAVVYL